VRILGCVIGLFCSLFANQLFAAGELPKVLVGEITPYNRTYGRTGTNAGLRVEFDGQPVGGVVSGKMTLTNSQYCVMDRDRVTGTYDAATGALTLKATFRDKFPNAGCKERTLLLKRTDSGGFNGDIPVEPESPWEYPVKLSPES